MYLAGLYAKVCVPAACAACLAGPCWPRCRGWWCAGRLEPREPETPDAAKENPKVTDKA